jgi:glycosyltransferase involved in cell wall biosynthesis
MDAVPPEPKGRPRVPDPSGRPRVPDPGGRPLIPEPSNRPRVPERRDRPRVLFISADPVGEQMSGLGIRYWELARVLSAHAEVTVAHGGSEQGESEGVRMLAYRPHAPAALRGPIAESDTIVAHPQWPLVDRWLKRSSAKVVIDLYCPETLETLELLGARRKLVRRQLTAITIDRLHAALRTGHHFMCASEAQRDLWLGAMLGLRLIGPELYESDPSLRATIDLVPFGVPDDPPKPLAGAGPRRSIPALGADSEIVLWNGGIWSWLDAETAIRAVAGLARRRPGVRLLFMGAAAHHPAAALSTRAARDLASELGVLGSVVHFHEQWVPYAERGTWLTQADCALSTHADHLEARFAFRTRLLDCFWAGLPVVCTQGDELADLIAARDMGAVAPAGDVEALSAAVELVLDRGRAAYGAPLAEAAAEYAWPRAAAPLVRWIGAETSPMRPGDSPGSLRAPLGQRLREAAYLGGGRRAMARRRSSSS